MIATIRISIVFWVLAVSAILIAGQGWQRGRAFRGMMLQQWQPSLILALLYMVSAVLGGTGVFPFYSIAIFCQALIGLGLASEIEGYDPLPVTQALTQRRAWSEALALLLPGTLGIMLAALVVNGFLVSLLLQLFGESMNSPQGVAAFFPPNAFRSFLLMLAGAGLFEETLFRLVCLSLFWRLTGRPWTAILVSALLFGAYHLSPLDSAYLQYWERPLTIFSLSTIMGIVMGYAYRRYGYETAVLGHTLGNWVALWLSRAG